MFAQKKDLLSWVLRVFIWCRTKFEVFIVNLFFLQCFSFKDSSLFWNTLSFQLMFHVFLFVFCLGDENWESSYILNA